MNRVEGGGGGGRKKCSNGFWGYRVEEGRGVRDYGNGGK